MAKIQQIKVIRRLQEFDDDGLVQLAIGLKLQPRADRQGLIFQISRAVSAAGEWPAILPAPPPVRNIKPKPIRGDSLPFVVECGCRICHRASGQLVNGVCPTCS
jgi:hypothetical protein